jgi:hypothetical protein
VTPIGERGGGGEPFGESSADFQLPYRRFPIGRASELAADWN